MKALVYHGPGERGWDNVDDPTIVEPTDAIVRIDTSTICGTDLHILKGDVPETTAGTILGHEAVGAIMEVGASVTTVAPGDRVLMSCVSSCGRCRYCKEGRYGQRACTRPGGSSRSTSPTHAWRARGASARTLRSTTVLGFLKWLLRSARVPAASQQ
jgi:alcohol dehydrogenase